MFTIQIYEMNQERLFDIPDENWDNNLSHYRNKLSWVATYFDCNGDDLIGVFYRYHISYKDINTFDPLMKFDVHSNSKFNFQYNFWSNVFRPDWDQTKYLAIVFDKNGLAFTPYSLCLKGYNCKLNNYNERIYITRNRNGRHRCAKYFRHTKHRTMSIKDCTISQKECEKEVYQSGYFASLDIPKIKHLNKTDYTVDWDANVHSEKGNCWKTKKIKKQYTKNRHCRNYKLLNKKYLEDLETEFLLDEFCMVLLGED